MQRSVLLYEVQVPEVWFGTQAEPSLAYSQPALIIFTWKFYICTWDLVDFVDFADEGPFLSNFAASDAFAITR